MDTPLRVLFFVMLAISAALSFSAPAHTIVPHRYLADAGATTVAITVAVPRQPCRDTGGGATQSSGRRSPARADRGAFGAGSKPVMPLAALPVKSSCFSVQTNPDAMTVLSAMLRS